MFCRNCGHEQNDGKFCDVCGKPLGEVADVPSPAVESKAAKKPKAPIVAVAAVCAVAIGVGVFALSRLGSDDIKMDDVSKAAESKGIAAETDIDTSTEDMTAPITTTVAEETADDNPADTDSDLIPETPADDKIIPAEQLFTVNKGKLQETIGDDYYAVELNGRYGITSDTFFPDVVLYPCPGNFEDYANEDSFTYASAATVLRVYEDMDYFDFFKVEGTGNACIAEGAYCGMAYSELYRSLDSLNGLYSDGSTSGVSMEGFTLQFSPEDKILEASLTAHNNDTFMSMIYPFDPISSGIDPICTGFKFFKVYDFYEGFSAFAVTDGVVIRNAPFESAQKVIELEEGGHMTIQSAASFTCDGQSWYWVTSCVDSDTLDMKIGFVRADQVEVKM